MSAAAADFFLAGQLPPAGKSTPARGTPLYQYLYLRQGESIGPGITTAIKFRDWMALSDRDLAANTANELGALEEKLSQRGVAPLGLVLAGKGGDITSNHQVLALSIDRGERGASIRIYDPNYPGDDAVTIEWRREGPHTLERQGEPVGAPIRGFFLVPYEPRTPPTGTSRN